MKNSTQNKYYIAIWQLILFISMFYVSITGFGYMVLDKYQEILAIVFVMACAFLSLSNYNVSYKKSINLSFIIFFLFWILIVKSYFSSYSTTTTWKYILKFAVYVCIPLFYFNCKFVNKIIKVFEIIALIVAITVIFSVANSNLYMNIFGFLYVDSAGIWNSINQGAGVGIIGVSAYASYIINVGIAIVVAFIFAEKKIKIKQSVYLTLFLIALFATGKRTILIAALLAILIIFLFSSDKKKYRVFLKVIIVIGTIGALSYLFVPQAQIMFERFVMGMGDKDLNNRRIFWEEALFLFNKNPIWGNGFGIFPVFDKIEGTRWGYSAHNIYLEILAELGLTGIIVYILFSIYVIIKSIKLLCNKKLINDPNVNKAIYFVFYLLFSHEFYGIMEQPLYAFSLQFIFMVVLSLLNSLCRYEKKGENCIRYLGIKFKN